MYVLRMLFALLKGVCLSIYDWDDDVFSHRLESGPQEVVIGEVTYTCYAASLTTKGAYVATRADSPQVFMVTPFLDQVAVVVNPGTTPLSVSSHCVTTDDLIRRVGGCELDTAREAVAMHFTAGIVHASQLVAELRDLLATCPPDKEAADLSQRLLAYAHDFESSSLRLRKVCAQALIYLAHFHNPSAN